MPGLLRGHRTVANLLDSSECKGDGRVMHWTFKFRRLVPEFAFICRFELYVCIYASGSSIRSNRRWAETYAENQPPLVQLWWWWCMRGAAQSIDGKMRERRFCRFRKLKLSSLFAVPGRSVCKHFSETWIRSHQPPTEPQATWSREFFATNPVVVDHG